MTTDQLVAFLQLHPGKEVFITTGFNSGEIPEPEFEGKVMKRFQVDYENCESLENGLEEVILLYNSTFFNDYEFPNLEEFEADWVE